MICYRDFNISDRPFLESKLQEFLSGPDTGLHWTTTMLSEVLNSSPRVFVADEDDCIVGFLIIRPLVDADEIQLIAVDPQKRGRSVAFQLVQQALKSGAQNRPVWLEVANSNTPAIGLYKKLGFAQVGIRKNYYPNGADALLMTLSR